MSPPTVPRSAGIRRYARPRWRKKNSQLHHSDHARCTPRISVSWLWNQFSEDPPSCYSSLAQAQRPCPLLDIASPSLKGLSCARHTSKWIKRCATTQKLYFHDETAVTNSKTWMASRWLWPLIPYVQRYITPSPKQTPWLHHRIN